MPHENTPEPDAILDSFRKRVTPELVESLFQCCTIMGPSPLTEYLRLIVRNSPAAQANWELILFRSDQAGVTVGRRCAFKMGIVLGILMAEGIPRPNFVDVAYANLRLEREREREAVAVEG
jgi:hypothetical protein